MIRLAMSFLLIAASAAAQSEDKLQAAFEGKQVVVKIDMPASSSGVDVQAQRNSALKAEEYYRELQRYGTAITKGTSIIVTKVKVQDKYIEFQLGGGGAGGWNSGPNYIPLRKSAREVELELKPERTARETDELTGLQRQRMAEDARLQKEAAEAAKKERLARGSRFNIRYDTKITPEQLTPDAVRAVLKDYITFEGAPTSTTEPSTGTGGVRDPSGEQKTKPLVVMIKGQLGEDETIGAGIIIGIRSDRMYIVTANHVVRRGGKESQNVRVLFEWLPGEWRTARLLDSADNGLDLAVLSVENVKSLAADHLVYDRLSAKPPAVQQGVFFIGYGGAESWHTRRAPDAISGVSGETIRFQSSFLVPGDSGGVLVTEDWRIIGMLRSDTGGDANALSMQRILEKLNEWNFPVQLRAGG
jgi:hypothetical protein